MKSSKRPARRRRSKGVLVGLRDTGGKGRRRGPESPWRRALRWAGIGLAAAALVVLVVLFVPVMFMPDLGARSGESDAEVVEIVEEGPLPDGAVAAALVVVEGRPARVPLTPERREEVSTGSRLRLRYTLYPRTGVVQVDSWEPLPPSDRPGS